jgi:hypothetical protein
VELVGRGSLITQTRFQGIGRLRPHGVQGLCAGRAADPARETIQTCGRNLQWAITLDNTGTNGSAAVERNDTMYFLFDRGPAEAERPGRSLALPSPHRLTELTVGATDTACAIFPG